VENVDTKIDRYLRLLRLPDCESECRPGDEQRQLEITQPGQVLILGMVRAILKETPIVITHAADTMVETDYTPASAAGIGDAFPNRRMTPQLKQRRTPDLTESLLAAEHDDRKANLFLTSQTSKQGA